MSAHLRPTKGVLQIAAALEGAGFEAWCVGGAIRDAMLGDDPLDWDLATAATPEQVRSLFGRRRTIPVGIEFGTVVVLDEQGVPHEVTTFRRDVRTDGRHAEVEFGASLEEDLARRDFTINAIAYRPRTDEIRDPFGGRADLERGIVRAVGDAEERMREDRLRALRAIRFASRYHFDLDPATLAAIRSSAPHLTRLSHERVQQELVKTMEQVRRPSEALRVWRDVGALAVLVPVLARADDVALATLDELPRAREGAIKQPQRTSNRVAALFLDVEAAEAREALSGLRFSKHETSWAVALVERWHSVGVEIAAALRDGQPSDAQVRRWVARLGRLRAGAFLRVALARWQAMTAAGLHAPAESAVRTLHRRMRAILFRDPIELADLRVTGDDLRRAGIPAGPIYAKILHALLERVLEDPARNSPDALLAEVPGIVAALGAGGGSPVQPSSEQ
ncbi:MAG TPA: CCA tRNA nucleotidyltransferase [Gemmatimonadaceae bacterium]|nr:CCA tRNA nucleotidyltransferase [Gemmatimonadaceae bacterium]